MIKSITAFASLLYSLFYLGTFYNHEWWFMPTTLIGLLGLLITAYFLIDELSKL